MTGFDAWYLPGWDGPTTTLEVGSLTCRYPVPDPELVRDAVDRLRAARHEILDRPADEIVTAVDAAAARLADPADALRQEAEDRVAAATGYSGAMARRVLDRMAADWRADRLRRLIRSELGDPAALDDFVAVAPGRSARAYGPDLTFQVFAGNVPGVAVTAMIRALLVKSPTFGKLASGQPVLPVLFARALESVDADLARALAITYWPGGGAAGEEAGAGAGATDAAMNTAAVEAAAVEAADIVVVYGGADVERAYRDRLAGIDTSRGGLAGAGDRRLVVHGPRFSVGLVDGAYAAAEGVASVAADVAEAVAAFDQHGCVSPHAVWVQGTDGCSALDFAEALAGAMAALEKELPRGRLSPAEASAIQQERSAAELRGHTARSADGVVVWSDEGTAWTVIHDPDPAFRPSCLNRFVRVHPVADLDDVPALLSPHGRLLQSAAVAADADRRARLADPLVRAGASRITTFDRLPWPPPDWHHDGSAPLRELVRWADLEE